MKTIKPLLCLYHNNCMDGFAAAWVVWKKYRHQTEIEFMNMDYDDPIPDLAGRNVIIVDYSFNQVEEFVEACKHALTVEVLDHHKGAREKYRDVVLSCPATLKFDEQHSGCVVTWEYLFPGQNVPAVLSYIEDRDLWKFEHRGSRPLHYYLKAQGFLLRSTQEKLIENFHKLDRIMVEMSVVSPLDVFRYGEHIQMAEETLLASILERTRTVVNFEEYGPSENDPETWVHQRTWQIPIAEVPYEFASEAGNLLSEGYPFSVTYETQWALGKRKFSIRSNQKTGVNVLPIAQKMGGSGHEHAAGWYEDIHAELPFSVIR